MNLLGTTEHFEAGKDGGKTGGKGGGKVGERGGGQGDGKGGSSGVGERCTAEDINQPLMPWMWIADEPRCEGTRGTRGTGGAGGGGRVGGAFESRLSQVGRCGAVLPLPSTGRTIGQLSHSAIVSDLGGRGGGGKSRREGEDEEDEEDEEGGGGGGGGGRLDGGGDEGGGKGGERGEKVRPEVALSRDMLMRVITMKPFTGLPWVEEVKHLAPLAPPQLRLEGTDARR